MRSISGKDFASLLKKKGWILQRIKGSHYIFSKTNYEIRISVPIHGNKPLKIGLLKHLMKIANIIEDEI